MERRKNGILGVRRGACGVTALLVCMAAISAAPKVARCTPRTLSGSQPSRGDLFSVLDYDRLRSIRELTISSDGRYVAFMAGGLHYCRFPQKCRGEVYISETSRGSEVKHIERLDGAGELQWRPGTHELAALLTRASSTQVYSYSVPSDRLECLTTSKEPIVYFDYSLDGTLAYIAKADNGVLRKSTIYWLAQHAQHGLIMDPERTFMFSFRDPSWQQEESNLWGNPGRLWIQRATGVAAEALVPGDVESFSWGPHSRKVAVSYVANEVPATGLPIVRSYETSVGVFDVVNHQFTLIAPGTGPWGSAHEAWYAAGEWTKGGNGIVLLRFGKEDWASGFTYPHWSIVSPLRRVDPVAWQRWPTLETITHPSSPAGAAAFVSSGAHTVLVDAPVAGRFNLYAFSDQERAAPVPLIPFGGDVAEVASTPDGLHLAFVGQSLTNPPEVYLLTEGSIRRITSLNAFVRGRIGYKAVPVTWRGAGGVPVSGWLLEPSGSGPPWPMVTFVHGGPLYPMTDSFARYYATWPYPFEALASHGIAVFEPNYRGTVGFGRDFAAPKATDLPNVPALDVILGITYLEDSGLADPRRLGICGQSVGAWMGPFVMEMFRGFVAASFAEGIGNTIVNYVSLAGAFNEYVNNPVSGGSYYRSPLLYLEQSPDLHLTGISTPMLLENGTYTELEYGLDMGQAAAHAHEPAEWVVYPHTGHYIGDSALARESARRNFAWFEFFLRGMEDASVTRAEEIAMWKQWRHRGHMK